MSDKHKNFKEGDQVKVTMCQGGFKEGDICILIELTDDCGTDHNQWKIGKGESYFWQNEFAMERVKP